MASSEENNVEQNDVATTNPSDERIDTPNPNDVLCGRGGNINSHRGNEQFRSLVEKRKRVYLTARFKREKRLIASSIVNEIRAMDPPGRFLARKGSMKDNSGYWYDIGDEKARDKTSQALRENAPSIRAEIETEISQQRAEMRRQDANVEPAATIATKPAAPYPPPPHAHHHGHGTPPPPPPPHGQQPPPPPPLGHPYNPTHQSHYAQQYYDYYYHYYGYGAPPPPPPPGYSGNGAPPPPPPPPHGYPPAPTAPYYANVAPPAPTAHPAHPPAPASAEIPKSTNEMDSAMPAHPDQATEAMKKQEEEDRRLAMALQQEENVKAFEDRNRRFGSDRRSSRSTAYCAPGYRPRLLNDSVEGTGAMAGSSPGRKKRPPMSASHYLAHASPSNARTHTDSNMDTYEMDLKPPAKEKEPVKSMSNGLNQHDMEHHHNDHDFSYSSQHKDDSDIMSVFGELGKFDSTGSITRVRNMFMGKSNNASNSQNYNPIALNQGERNRRNEQHSQQQHTKRDRNNEHQQDSSLLSQVAHHILGNFGVGGSFVDNDTSHNNTDDSVPHDHSHGDNMDSEMEMELGQEVIMDVRDESSSMPPPHARGSGTQIDWASRAGCHSWIPDAIGYNETPSSHFVQRGNNRDQSSSSHHGNDHSLTRQGVYRQTDISPINSMDMDFSRSSINGSQRSRANLGRGNSATFMNVFDHKHDDSHPEQLLPQIHRSALQSVPSWERSYRSRSEISLGDLSGANGLDNSMIRVNSHTNKLFKKKGTSSGHQIGHENIPENANHQVHQENNHQAHHDMDMDWD